MLAALLTDTGRDKSHTAQAKRALAPLEALEVQGMPVWTMEEFEEEVPFHCPYLNLLSWTATTMHGKVPRGVPGFTPEMLHGNLQAGVVVGGWELTYVERRKGISCQARGCKASFLTRVGVGHGSGKEHHRFDFV